ncbi:MAG: hypothetical protein JW893_06830 [Candidatus Omnitrophica bacterium]|nr:hypothetical protein [Candidatus Omnitrophota bacterium]
MPKTLLGMFVLVVIVGLFHMGTVRKKEDPIRNTQTDPVAYKAKQEELKDGPKGAPAPSLKFYEKEEFLIEPPMKDQGIGRGEEVLDEFVESWEDETLDYEEGTLEEDWWFEEWDEEETASSDLDSQLPQPVDNQ